MDADDLLDAGTSWVQHPAANPLACAPGWVGIGARPPGPTLWSSTHHANLLSSLLPLHTFFFIVVVLSAHVIGVEQRCFNLIAAQI